jgi:hypothetical protein
MRKGWLGGELYARPSRPAGCVPLLPAMYDRNLEDMTLDVSPDPLTRTRHLQEAQRSWRWGPTQEREPPRSP